MKNRKILFGLLVLSLFVSCKEKCKNCEVTTQSWIGTVDDPYKQKVYAEKTEFVSKCGSELKNVEEDKRKVYSTEVNTSTGYQTTVTKTTSCE